MTEVNYSQKSINLFEDFFNYLETSQIGFPNGSHVLFFDENDSEFNKQSLSLLKSYKAKGEKTVEATKTESTKEPWRIALTIT